MYLSKIYLNRGKRETARAFYNPQIFHGALENCFRGERQHPLWRIDGDGIRNFMLVVSRDIPDFSAFQEAFGYDDRPAITKDYETFLEKGFRDGDILRFHLAANPTIKIAGKRIPLNKKGTDKYPYSAVDWAKDRLKKHGAEVVEVQLSSYKEKTATGNGRKMYYVMAEYDGILRVIDKNEFALALAKGIGHEKAYGCGMISVMHV